MRTIKYVYIHVGTHKTGSTFLQKFLLSNRKTLLKNGIFLPILNELDSKLQSQFDSKNPNFHLPIVRALALGESNTEAKDTFQKLEQLVRRYSAQAVVLSSEIFEDQLSNDNIELLERFFSKLGYKTVFVAYVRNQPDYINSRYTQIIKRFWDDCSFDNYLQQALSMEIFDYNQLFANLLSNKSVSFIARSFDQATRKGLERDFLDIIFDGKQFDFTEFEQVGERQNQAPGPLTIYAARLARQNILSEFPNEKDLYRLWKPLKRISNNEGWNKNKFVGVSTRKAREIEKKFKMKNDIFANMVWGTRWQNCFEEKEFQRNIFQRNEVTNKELWKIDCAVENILTIARTQNNITKNWQQHITDLTRILRKKYRYINYH